MAEVNINSRNSCALHGALQTVSAVKGLVPLLHTTAGCGVQHWLGTDFASGGLGVPSTNVAEKQIVFGGTSRLREQIKNTVKVVRGDLYIVLSGCATELVGDDIPAMVKESRDQGYPVIYLKTPGFCGPAHYGYEIAVKGIIDQLAGLPTPADGEVLGNVTVNNLVNIFGIVPNQDPFWQGDLGKLSQILGEVGLSGNTLLGFGADLTSWRLVQHAKLNLVFSSSGLAIARHLEQTYGQPYLYLDSLPVGFAATQRLVRQLEHYFHLEKDRIQDILQREAAEEQYYLGKLADRYFNYDFQTSFAIVGESRLVAGISQYLINPLGFIPQLVIMTDRPGESFRQTLVATLEELLPGQRIVVTETEDLREIEGLIRENQVELVLGSALEAAVARETSASLVQTAYPINDRVILNQSYLGVAGGIALAEDVSRVLMER